MFTWTETPLVDMWGQLRYLASSANVYNLLTGKLPSQRPVWFPESTELEQKSYEIASCIRQADEYYRSADSVSLATQPLLHFYGASALAKAVILANIPELKLSALNFHGLCQRLGAAKEFVDELKDYNDKPTQWEVEKEYAISNDGVFPYLCKAVDDLVLPNGHVFIFKELLSTIPDMARRFAHFSEPSHCFYLNDYPDFNQDKKLHISLGSREKPNKVISVFPELEKEFEQIADGFLSRNQLEKYPLFFRVQEGTVAGIFLVRPLRCGIYKSFPILFATLFILSNIVRYKPAFWMKVIDGQTSGVISIVEAFCNVAKRRLPNDALDAIWNERFTYGTPARFS